MENEKGHDLPTVDWRIKKSDVLIQSEPKRLWIEALVAQDPEWVPTVSKDRRRWASQLSGLSLAKANWHKIIIFYIYIYIYRRRQWHPTPVLLPGKSHGWRSLVGCSPWGRWGSDTTERLHFHFSLSCIGEGNGNPLVFLPGESQGRGSLLGCHLWGCTESDTTEVIYFKFFGIFTISLAKRFCRMPLSISNVKIFSCR